MIRVAIAAILAANTAGCSSLSNAGIGRYDIEPFYDVATGSMQCCRASVVSGKDVANVHVTVTYTGAGMVVDLTEQGVNGSAGQAVAAQAAAGVAGAVTKAATSAVTLLK